MRQGDGKKPVDPNVITTLENAVLQADMKTGRNILREAAAAYGYETLISEVFEPIFTDIGERMKRQEVSLAQSYVLSLMVDDLLRIDQTASGAGKRMARRGPVVLANIEDDCHPLGRKIVSTILRLHDWDVCDLGIDVEARLIAQKAVEVKARVIGVSAMIFTTAENIRKVREEIDARGYRGRILLAVGGAVFRLRPELAAGVGADGTAANAVAALTLFEDLWRKAEEW